MSQNSRSARMRPGVGQWPRRAPWPLKPWRPALRSGCDDSSPAHPAASRFLGKRPFPRSTRAHTHAPSVRLSAPTPPFTRLFKNVS